MDTVDSQGFPLRPVEFSAFCGGCGQRWGPHRASLALLLTGHVFEDGLLTLRRVQASRWDKWRSARFRRPPPTLTAWRDECYEVRRRADGCAAAVFHCSRPGCPHQPVYRAPVLAEMIATSDGTVSL